MSGLDVLFTLASAGTAATAWLAVTRKNPVYGAAWMMAALFGLAVVFLMLHAPFAAVIQVLLYAGAILVLFLFVIMLINPGPDDPSIESAAGGMRIGGLAAAAAILVSIVAGLGSTDFGDPAVSFSHEQPLPSIVKMKDGRKLEGIIDRDQDPAQDPTKTPFVLRTAQGNLTLLQEDVAQTADFGDTAYFGYEVYDRYLAAFEVISLLVMVAIVGAIVLGKRKIDGDDEEAGTLAPDDAHPQIAHADDHAGHSQGARPELESAGHHH